MTTATLTSPLAEDRARATDLLRNVADALATAMRRRRDADHLLRLDDRLLSDIGLTRADIDAAVRGHTAR